MLRVENDNPMDVDQLYEYNEIFKKYQLITSPELFVKLITDVENDPQALKEIAKLACSSEISLMHIYSRQQKKQNNMIDILLKKYFEFGFPDELYSMIWSFFRFVSPSRSNFSVVINYIKEKFYDKQCTPSILNNVLKILEFMVTEKQHFLSEPSSQFIFNGPQSKITLENKGIQWPFYKGITLYVWIKIEEQFQKSNLISAYSDNDGFEFLIEGSKLIYRSQLKQQAKRIGLIELPINKWFQLVISVESKKFFLKDGHYIKVTCGSDIIEGIQVDFPTQMNQLSQLKLCEDLFGQVSSILMFQEAVPHNLQCGDPRFGIQDNTQIKNLIKTLEKQSSKILFCYSPLRSDGNIIVDFIRQLNGQLSQHSSVLIKQLSYQSMSQVCKIQNFIPLFQFLNTFNQGNYPDLLNQLLRILTILFRDAINCDLMSIVALQINQYGLSYVSQKTIEVMQEMKLSLLEKQLKIKFLLDFVLKIDFQKFQDFEVTKSYLKFIRASYNSNPEFYTTVYGVGKILDQAQSIEHASLLCCDEHARQVGITDYQSDTISLKERLGGYMQVLEAILYYYFFDNTANKDLTVQCFKELLSTFSFRHSPCYFSEILSLILRLLKYEREGFNPVTSLLAQEEYIRNVTYVLTFCNCPQVKTGCIKLIAEATRICGYADELELGIWIGYTLGNTAAAEQMVEQDTKMKLIIDHEPLYVSVMEWCLRRAPSKQEVIEFIIDEGDILRSNCGLNLLMSLYNFANDAVRGKVIQDLFMLAKWNKQNCQFLLTKDFIIWLQKTILEIAISSNSTEQTQYDNWVQQSYLLKKIWDTCLRLYGILIRYAIENNSNGHQTFTTISESLYSLCQVQYPQQEQEAQLMVRFICKYMLQGLNETCRNYINFNHVFWKNLQQITLSIFKLMIVEERQGSNDQTPETIPIVLQKFYSIIPKLFVIEANDSPKRWTQLYGSDQWVDTILVGCILEICNCITDSLPQVCVPVEDFQQLQKVLQEQLEFRNHKEHQQLTELLLHQYYFGQQDSQPPYMIQILMLSLQLGIEYYAFNTEVEKRKQNLVKIIKGADSLFRVFIVSTENSRERFFSDNEELQIISIIMNHIHFLFVVRSKILQEKNEDIVQIIKDAVLYTFKFIIILIETQNQKLGYKQSYQDMINDQFASNSIPTFKLFIVKIMEEHFQLEKSCIINLKDIISLKLNNKLLQSKVESPQMNMLMLQDQILMMVNDIKFQLDVEFFFILKVQFQQASLQIQQQLRSQDLIIKNVRQQAENKLIEIAQQAFSQQEEVRLRRLDNYESWVRNARYQLKKSWNQVISQIINQVRVFNELWTSTTFKAQNDNVFNPQDFDYSNIELNTHFMWKVWKYETKQKSRPLLKIKLNDQNNQIDLSLEKEVSQQRELKIFEYDSFDIAQEQKQQKLKDQQVSTIYGILRGIKNSFKSQSNNDDLLINKVIWIKTLTVRFGQMRLKGDKIIFYFESITQKETHQSLIKYRVPDEGRLIKEWSIENLVDIVKRRKQLIINFKIGYIGRKNSVEFFFLDGTTLVFSFPESYQDILIDRICQMRKSKCYSLKSHISSSQSPFQIVADSNSLQKWCAYEISTFQYLMKLNKISGRSYKDLTQYPIIPWIMHGGDQLGCYRDLTKPMGALGNEERSEVFRNRYDMVDHFNKVPQYHYGSHYSSPAIIFHYLIRLRPYADGARELQSGKFDLADRLFFNFVETYKNATEELSDVRELIPEFYYLPEMFVNYAKYDFGLQQSGSRVNNVELPEWCEQNPYKFICAHRVQLETDYVSQHINQWIDLIFGYKQRGELAAQSLNTFYYLTYEDSLDFDTLKNEKLRVSYESQMVHFGQTPSQIFQDSKHPTRPARKMNFRINDEMCSPHVFRQRNENNVQQYNRSYSISTIKFVSENKFYLSRRNGDVSLIRLNKVQNQLDQTQFEVVWEQDFQINLFKKNEQGFIFDHTANFEELPKLFIRGGKYIIFGGIWDGRLLIFNLQENIIHETYYDQTETITAIGSDIKQRIIATGSKSGQLCVYSNFTWNSTSILKLIAVQYHHTQMITCIYVCNDLKCIATSSQDGTINLYNMYTGRFLRSYQHPKFKSIDYVSIYTTPLYGIVFYCFEEMMLYSYSINGQFLANYSIDVCCQMQISKDSSLNDILCVAQNDGKKVIQLTTPFLYLRQEIKLTSNVETMAGVSTISLSPACKYMAFGARDGEIGVVVDTRSQ